MPEKEPLSKAELIIHPVRLRVLEVVQGRALTSQQIAGRLPDVPQATLYRQIKRLAEGGILAVVEERSIHGIVEKVYTLREGAAHFSREEFARIPAEEHARFFAIFLGTLSSRMNYYLQQEAYDTTEEGMTYFQAALQLNDAEARQLRLDLLDFVARWDARQMAPSAGRRLRTLGVAFIPESRDLPEATPEEDAGRHRNAEDEKER
ncbi:MAG TPA: helix-turn-helix domain-containing protein [Chthonomonadaceae bacterium]|nr:helix-turn-helix domain-containing protein [Chthonomonadaceae bacterium]